MSSFESQTRQECLNKRIITKYYDHMSSRSSSCNDPPAVTVVIEGRSICQMISLHKLGSYQSLAKTLQQMFVNSGDIIECSRINNNVDLSNALPGHLIAYEDIENDLLLVGDLNWK
ncbi:hypothetical protein R3W88_019288 [Solanum pinnatisectum]|uniref:Auxin-responsive protein n=1 Tax=Solanum pinnatisectum TaxID=50273 RepID=A0AAV9KIW4_9SOLN|nr:hypothetical protein R3W88_019288 [Solanum pinnatisectum]